MSGPNFSDTPPPEVPEEYGDAYREAYRKAYDEAQAEFPGVLPPLGVPDDTDEHAAVTVPAQTPAAALPGAQGEHGVVLPPPPSVPAAAPDAMRIGTHRAPGDPDAAVPALAEFRASAWFRPAMIAAAVVLLVIVAYLLGRLFGGGGDDAPAHQHTSAASTAGHTGQPKAHRTRHSTPLPNAYKGRVTRTSIASASATCTSKPGVDSSGKKVTYGVGHAIDDLGDSAWRCDGSAVGQKLVLHLDKAETIGQVGLVPGYAKTDPKSHVDRYAQNNRITKVRWTFDDGSQVVQKLQGSPKDRSLRTLRVPKTSSATVTLEILAVAKGPRNTTAISDVLVGLAG